MLCTINRATFRAIATSALLCGVTFAGTFSAAALTIQPGSLAATQSGNDLLLSFPTVTPNLYTLQTSQDLLQPWTNCHSGVAGDGTVKAVAITNAILGGSGFYRLLI